RRRRGEFARHSGAGSARRCRGMLGRIEAQESVVNQRGLGGAVLVLLVALAGCGDGLRGVIGDSAPRDRYETALERSGLGGSVLVRDWQTAARRAIDSAPVYEPPFLESGYLDPARPEARGYRISLRRGQRLNVEFSLRGV